MARFDLKFLKKLSAHSTSHYSTIIVWVIGNSNIKKLERKKKIQSLHKV